MCGTFAIRVTSVALFGIASRPVTAIMPPTMVMSSLKTESLTSTSPVPSGQVADGDRVEAVHEAGELGGVQVELTGRAGADADGRRTPSSA